MKEKRGFYAPDRRAAISVADVPAAIDIENLAGHEVCGSAISQTSPMRPTGWSFASAACFSGACIGVLMTPGATALTRIPRVAYSMASDHDAAFKPPFVTAASTAGKVWVGWSTRLAVMLMTWLSSTSMQPGARRFIAERAVPEARRPSRTRRQTGPPVPALAARDAAPIIMQ